MLHHFSLKLFLLAVALVFSASTYAIWQIANPSPNSSGQAITVDPSVGKTDYPNNYWSNKKYKLYLRKGLLYDNVKRYAVKHNWKVRWLASRDYPVMSNTTVGGTSFTAVMNRLFAMYPIYTYYNTKTHIMTVSSTKIIQKSS